MALRIEVGQVDKMKVVKVVVASSILIALLRWIRTVINQFLATRYTAHIFITKQNMQNNLKTHVNRYQFQSDSLVRSAI